jgi:riboflavin synthase
LSKFAKGTTVNIERALKADGRFGGHFVQGHIDGTGRIEKIDRSGEFWTVRFKADKNVLEQMVVKGSVAIDGISLTVADMNNSGFETAVIPETIKRTNLSKAKIGDEVNIETDLIVKVVTRQLRQIMPGEKLSIEKLKEMGF